LTDRQPPLTFRAMLTPDFATFASLARPGTLVPVARELLFDRDTAVTAYHKLRSGPFGFLLESLVGGEKWARYTFLGSAPSSAWRLRSGGSVSTWTPHAGWSEERTSDDPLGELDALLRSVQPVTIPGLPRFTGGAVGYLGYDIIRYIEELPQPPPADLDVPDALLIFTDTLLAIDNIYGRAHAVTTVAVGNAQREDELRRLYDDAVARVDAAVARLDEPTSAPPVNLPNATEDVAFTSTYSRDRYEADVERIREYIMAGDAFQVVLSQRLSVALDRDPFDLYRSLRALNPSPYLFFLELDGIALVGASPEVLVRVEESTVTVRPIAGTRPRGSSDDDDARLAAELMADEKERAEHLMLVDLGRNDVGRVSRYGSVHVPAFMNIEKYSHVLHLVSQVEGELQDGMSAMDVFRACFPAGTVSGAPKIRAMEIIDELEPVRRGIYAGAAGYFAWGGTRMDTAIAIRTVVAMGGRAWVQAGAGIVADSNAAAEYEETLAKARALLRALAG
jgi:anthranilate synthase component I